MDNAKTIRIFVDAHSFDTGYQGTQTFLLGLYTHLLKHHPELDIYFGAYHTHRIARAFPMLSPDRILTYRIKSPALLRYFTDIPALLRKHRFDLAHFQYIAPRSQPGCRYMVTIHDLLFNDYTTAFSAFYRRSRNPLFRRSIQQAAIKTTVSAYSRERIAAQYGIAPALLRVIPNGVNRMATDALTRARAIAAIKEKYNVEGFVLYTSRAEPRKNHFALLEAWLNLKLYEKGIPLVFIGQQSLSVAALAQKIKALTPRQQAQFHWLPQVNGEDLDRFYLAAKVFVYPSLAEGFGIPPLEAAMAEVPVICSNTTAMAAYDFFAPYHIDPQQPGILEECLHRIIENPPAPETLAAIARTIHEQYNWTKAAETLCQLFTLNTGLCN